MNAGSNFHSWIAPVRDAFHDPRTRVYWVVQSLVYLLILLALVGLVVELNLEDRRFADELEYFDRIVLALFAIEIILRVATYHPARLDMFRMGSVERVRIHITGRLRFLLSPLVLLDLLTVIALVPALRALRALRLFQLVRAVPAFRRSSQVRSLVRAFSESSLVYGVLFSFLALVIVVGGLSIYLAEGRTNAAMTSVADGIWWTLVTITTVGYGDITPETPLGRVFGGGIMVVGMFTLAMFAGVVGGTLLSTVLSIREEHFRMSTHVNHVVLCGYHEGARLLLDSMLEELKAGQRELVILAPFPRPKDLPPDFVWIEGDPTKERELNKVRMAEAASVILVGDRGKEPQEADGQTILTAFTIRAYMREQRTREKRQHPLYLVAEVLESENVEHARAAGADEVIETNRVAFSLIAHSLVAHGVGEIMAEVASSGHLSAYAGPHPYGELTYGELVSRLLVDYHIAVFGIRDDRGRRHLNPDEDHPVKADDEVIYLARRAVLLEASPEA